MMKFSVKNQPSKPQDAQAALQDITEAYEGMMTAYMELTDAQRDLDEVCQVMDNINLAMKMLKTSDKAIECLNVDGSLESLCECPFSDVTVEKATEGLGKSIKEGFKKFVDFVKRVLIAIRKWFFGVNNTAIVNNTKAVGEEIKKDKKLKESVEKREDVFGLGQHDWIAKDKANAWLLAARGMTGTFKILEGIAMNALKCKSPEELTSVLEEFDKAAKKYEFMFKHFNLKVERYEGEVKINIRRIDREDPERFELRGKKCYIWDSKYGSYDDYANTIIRLAVDGDNLVKAARAAYDKCHQAILSDLSYIEKIGTGLGFSPGAEADMKEDGNSIGNVDPKDRMRTQAIRAALYIAQVMHMVSSQAETEVIFTLKFESKHLDSMLQRVRKYADDANETRNSNYK